MALVAMALDPGQQCFSGGCVQPKGTIKQDKFQMVLNPRCKKSVKHSSINILRPSLIPTLSFWLNKLDYSHVTLIPLASPSRRTLQQTLSTEQKDHHIYN